MATIALDYVTVPGEVGGSAAEVFCGHGFPYSLAGRITETEIRAAAQGTIHADMNQS
jgi:hypothetical protein